MSTCCRLALHRHHHSRFLARNVCTSSHTCRHTCACNLSNNNQTQTQAQAHTKDPGRNRHRHRHRHRQAPRHRNKHRHRHAHVTTHNAHVTIPTETDTGANTDTQTHRQGQRQGRRRLRHGDRLKHTSRHKHHGQTHLHIDTCLAARFLASQSVHNTCTLLFLYHLGAITSLFGPREYPFSPWSAQYLHVSQPFPCGPQRHLGQPNLRVGPTAAAAGSAAGPATAAATRASSGPTALAGSAPAAGSGPTAVARAAGSGSSKHIESENIYIYICTRIHGSLHPHPPPQPTPGGRLVDWLVKLVGWLAGCWLVGWRVGGLVGWLIQAWPSGIQGAGGRGQVVSHEHGGSHDHGGSHHTCIDSTNSEILDELCSSILLWTSSLPHTSRIPMRQQSSSCSCRTLQNWSSRQCHFTFDLD